MDRLDIETEILRALANPLRFQIIKYLSEVNEPKCVNNIVHRFNKSQSLISSNLSILKQAGLVKVVKEGQFVRYSVKSDSIKELLSAVRKLSEEYLRTYATIQEE